MKVFWARGYTATTLQDLLGAMNIARSSFYAAFGDKRTLFIECLELFGERTRKLLESPELELAPERAAAVFFEKSLFDVSRHRLALGCMLVNTVLEMAQVDPELGQLAARKLTAIETSFSRLFGRAITRQRLPDKPSPDDLARYVMNVNQGLRVQCRKTASTPELRSIVNTSLSLAGLAA
jgi:TetR/AcrR family transcriptional repressor of nem operon